MVEIKYNQSQLDAIVNNLNSIELAVGRNIPNAQRILEIFNILSAGIIIEQNITQAQDFNCQNYESEIVAKPKPEQIVEEENEDE